MRHTCSKRGCIEFALPQSLLFLFFAFASSKCWCVNKVDCVVDREVSVSEQSHRGGHTPAVCDHGRTYCCNTVSRVSSSCLPARTRKPRLLGVPTLTPLKTHYSATWWPTLYFLLQNRLIHLDSDAKMLATWAIYGWRRLPWTGWNGWTITGLHHQAKAGVPIKKGL